MCSKMQACISKALNFELRLTIKSRQSELGNLSVEGNVVKYHDWLYLIRYLSRRICSSSTNGVFTQLHTANLALAAVLT